MAPGFLKFKRTLSSSNILAANNIHDYIHEQQKAIGDRLPQLQRDVTKSSMIIPSQYGLPALELCVDEDMLREFIMAKSINWFLSARFLVPLYTERDGNCLLHAISLYIFGVHDRNNTIRKLLYQRLFMETEDGLLRRRWKRQKEIFLETLVSSDASLYSEERDKVWRNVVETCSERNVSYGERGTVFGMLSDIHVFAIANILGRAIIILCDHLYRNQDRESIQAPRLGGVYLPVTRSPEHCERSPIVIGYKNEHFLPLMSSENLEVPICDSKPLDSAQHCVPLIHHDMSALPVHFLFENEKPREFIAKYMEVIDVPSNMRYIEAALLKFKPPPAWSIELMWSLQKLPENEIVTQQDKYDESMDVQMPQKYRTEPAYASLKPCARQAVGCTNFSSNNKENMCTVCYEQYKVKLNAIPRRPSKKNEVEKTPANTKRVYETPVTQQHYLLHECSVPGCTRPAIPDFYNKCGMCYSQQHIAQPGSHSLEDMYLSPNKDTQRILEQPVGNNSFYGENRNESIDRYTAQMNMKVALHSPVDSSNSIFNFSGHSDMAGDARAPSNYNEAPQAGASNGLHSPVHVSPQSSIGYGAGTAAAPTSHIEAPSHDMDKSSYIRRKVLCKIAGCENGLNLHDSFCDEHMNEGVAPKRRCCMDGCTSTAETNDADLCMLCFQRQKNILKQYECNSQYTANSRNPDYNIGRGNISPQTPYSSGMVDLASIVSSLPEMPAPSLPASIPPIPPVNPTLSYQSNSSRNSQFGVSSQTGLNPGMSRHGIALSSPRHNVLSHDEFYPPQVYEGFSAGNRTLNYGSQHGVLNWQKERVSSTQCRYCDNHAHPEKNGYCNECYRIKQMQGNAASLKKCVNDGCRNPGQEQFNYLCDSCYDKQMQGLHGLGSRTAPPLQSVKHGNFLMEQMRREERASQQPVMRQTDYAAATTPCGTRGCINMAILPAGLCNVCQRNPPNFQRQEGCIDSRPKEFSVNNTVATEGERKQCKALDCEFFGSQEYGGYCSSCFLEITKQEVAKKQNGIRTYAPPDVHPDPPKNRIWEGRGPTALPYVHGVAAPVECINMGCDMFGRPEWNGYCSKCFKTHHVERDAVLA